MYTITQTQMTALTNNFIEAALWSNDVEDLTIFDITEEMKASVQEEIQNFCNTLTEDQAWEFLKDCSESGHNLALEMQGHGAGFFDVVNNPTYASISDKVEDFKTKFDDVYEVDGKLEIGFYS